MEERMEVADILLRYNKLDMALEVLEELRSEFPREKEIYYKLAKVFEKKGFYDKALDSLNSAKMLDPKCGETYFKIAIIYQMKAEINKCFENLSLSLEKGFDSEKVFFYKGLVYEETVDFDKAIYNYNKALSKERTFMEAKYRKYSIFMKLNRIDDAKAVVEDMIKYNGDEYDGFNLKFLLSLNEKRYEDAFEILNKAKNIFNNYSPLSLDYVKYYLIKEKYAEALEIINSISNEDGYYEDFMICKSKILMAEGKEEDALDLLSDELVYNEENSELVFMLALLSYKLGKLESSINYLNIICKMDKLDGDYDKMALLLKGYVLKEKGEEEASIKHFKYAYSVFKIQSLSNPYDINTLFYRAITLIEAEEYETAENILAGIARLEEQKYDSKIDEITKLMLSKKEAKEDVMREKEIVTEILNGE